jgi:hypothetical protein
MKKYRPKVCPIKRLILLISIVIFMCGCSSQNGPINDPLAASINSNDDAKTFQEYLWYQNPVVLLLFIAVMLAGAIGVSALLPAPYEEEIVE